jgi:hypothetical protein
MAQESVVCVNEVNTARAKSTANVQFPRQDGSQHMQMDLHITGLVLLNPHMS